MSEGPRERSSGGVSTSPDIARKWGRSLPADHVHIVAVPAPSREPLGIHILFAGLLGIDVERLEIDEGTSNRSLGYEQAELLRRVNVALGRRLLDIRTEYRPAVRELLINGALRMRPNFLRRACCRTMPSGAGTSAG